MRWCVAMALLVGCGEPGRGGWMGVGRIDQHADGSQDETLHRRLDADHRVMWEEWFSPLVDTLPGWRSELRYDGGGFVVEQTYDLYGDGILDQWETWTRDGEGRALRYERLDPDGEPIAVTTFTYDETLLVELRAESIGPDWEDDLATYRYDRDGRVLAVEHDYRVDGRIDRREEHTYSRAAPSIDGDYRLDVDGDGLWELDRFARYDSEGRMVRSDGEEYGVILVRDVVYDPVGRMVSSRETTKRAATNETWRYDDRGLLLESASAFHPLVAAAGEDDLTRELWDWTPVD